jgi:hypothetical protein
MSLSREELEEALRPLVEEIRTLSEEVTRQGALLRNYAAGMSTGLHEVQNMKRDIAEMQRRHSTSPCPPPPEHDGHSGNGEAA